jgi:hypothetical protein
MDDKFIPQPRNIIDRIRPLSERDQKIKNRMDDLRRIRPMEKMEQILNEIHDFVARIDAKYKNSRDYSMLHAIIGSGMMSTHKNVVEDDFPGDDSIEKFVDYLENKYKV